MIIIKAPSEIEIMRQGGKILAAVLEKVGQYVKSGTSTFELDRIAYKEIVAKGGTPAFRGYREESRKPFPATLCVSLNDEVVHGVPQRGRIIRTGDLVKIDAGMKYKRLFTDMARTFCAGNVSSRARKLVETTQQALDEGIKALAPGVTLGDYASRVQKFVESRGFSVVRQLVGHGIGRTLHEDPNIPNYHAAALNRIVLGCGMTLALEPMVNEGFYEVVSGENEWVFKTKDGKLSAHFEDTVAITKSGVEILTSV